MRRFASAGKGFVFQRVGVVPVPLRLLVRQALGGRAGVRRVSLYKLRSRGTPPRCRFRPANSRGSADCPQALPSGLHPIGARLMFKACWDRAGLWVVGCCVPIVPRRAHDTAARAASQVGRVPSRARGPAARPRRSATSTTRTAAPLTHLRGSKRREIANIRRSKTVLP